MPVIQVNIWICEVCGDVQTTKEKTDPYSDPVVTPPNGEEWNYVGEYTGSVGDEKLACPACLKAEKDKK